MACLLRMPMLGFGKYSPRQDLLVMTQLEQGDDEAVLALVMLAAPPSREEKHGHH